MTVAELIEELRKQDPWKPVKIALSMVWMGGMESEEYEQPLCDDDAIEADTVSNQGAHVLIRSA